MSGDDESDYEVGYARPPKATRFQPGQSGNPRGRPKRPRSIGEMFDREFARKRTIREDGREKKVPKLELWVRRVVADAIKGEYRAARILMEMRRGSEEEIARSVADQSINDLTDEDRAILERYLSSDASRKAE